MTQCTLPDGAHPGLIGSHWMPPLGECLHLIAPVAAMVIVIGGKHKNTNKTQLVASNHSTNQSLVVYENFIPKKVPLLSSLMCQATTIGAEVLTDISNYQTLSEDKNWRSYKPSTKLVKNGQICSQRD